MNHQIAIIGATGLVGREILTVMNEKNYPLDNLLLCGSAHSAGSVISLSGKKLNILSLEDVLSSKPEIALFSAGSEASLKHAPQFEALGCAVVDNSSAFRMYPNIPLVVPEINFESIQSNLIIANPNCSTIQLVMVLHPLHLKYGIKRVVVSTYQSVSGSGKKGVDQLQNERSNIVGTSFYQHPIDQNCLPQCDSFLPNGYTKEEMKIVNETRKILNLPNLRITSTAVRVPVLRCHSESVNIEFENPFDIEELKNELASYPNIIVQDDPNAGLYPMALTSGNKNEVFVGRIRRDESLENGINLWIVADNLRKGAASNAVQIAEKWLQDKNQVCINPSKL